MSKPLSSLDMLEGSYDVSVLIRKGKTHLNVTGRTGDERIKSEASSLHCPSA